MTSPKWTFNPITNLGSNTASAQSAINTNYSTLQTLLDNFLSWDGTTPNSMTADLDLNSHKVLNLAAPINPTDAVRLEDISTYLTAVQLSESNAAATLEDFETKYLGAASIDPVFDLDGNALQNGALYFNLPGKIMRVWNGSAWEDIFDSAAVIPVLASVSTDDAIVRFDGVLGNTQNSGVLIDDSNNITGAKSLYQKSGGVIDWGNGNVTLTHSSNTLNIGGLLNIILAGAGNVGIELGRQDGSSSTPYIDWHSGATDINYDSRIIASGGNGTNGQGLLTFQCSTNLTSATDLPSVWTQSGQAYHKFTKSFTGTAHDTGDILNVSGLYDGVLSTQSTMGYVIRCGGTVGSVNTTTTAGSVVVFGPGVDIQNAVNPSGGGLSEFAIMTAVVECKPSPSVGNYGLGVWGLDITVHGTNTSDSTKRDGYLTGGNIVVTKSSISNTVDNTHFGSNCLCLTTVPSGGASAYSFAGTTSYTMNDGLAITGFSGAVDTVANGHAAGATAAFDYGVRVGGSSGAAWTHLLSSKMGTCFYGLDHITYGLQIGTRHPDATGQAIYVQSDAGSVGIWQAPVSGANYPLVVGTSTAGNQNIRIDNLNAGATATTRLEMNTNAGSAALQWVSTAAGGAMSLYAPGPVNLVSTTGNVGVATTNVTRIVFSDTAMYPNSSGAIDLGITSTNPWGNLFIKSGGKVDFNNGNVTVTHSSGLLTFTGTQVFGTQATVNGPILAPYQFNVHTATNQNFAVYGNQNLADGVSLSSINDANSAVKGLEFLASQIYLNAPTTYFPSAATLSFNSGNVTQIHSAGVMTWNSKLVTSVAGLALDVTNSTNATSDQVAKWSSVNSTRAAQDSIYHSFFLANAAGTQREFARLQVNAAVVTDTSERGKFVFNVMSSGTLTDVMELNNTALSPGVTGATDLGNTSLPWGNAYFASAKKLDFNNGNVTLTHSSGRLTLAGGDLYANGVLLRTFNTISGAVNTIALHLGASFDNAGGSQSIDFYGGNDGTDMAEIRQGLDASGNKGTLAFYTYTGSALAQALKLDENQNVKFSSAASFTANNNVATSLGSIGPTGSHTTVQTWLTIIDSGGATRYIPCF